MIKKIKSVCLIMDGNRRYAKKKNISLADSYEHGAIVAEKIIRTSLEIGLEEVCFFAFSSENFHRSDLELSILENVITNSSFEDNLNDLKESINLFFVGERYKFAESVQNKKKLLEQKFNGNKIKVIIYAGFSGRLDIINAFESFNEEKKNLLKKAKNLDDKYKIFSSFLSQPYCEPDLIIRTGVHKRISNFLLWNIAYSNIHFLQILWPELTIEEYKKCIDFYELNTVNNYGV